MNKLAQALAEDTAARAMYKQRFRLGSTMHSLALLLADQEVGFEFKTSAIGSEDRNTIAKYLHRMAEHGYIERIGRGLWRIV